METIYDRLGVTAAAGWVEGMASGAAGVVQQGADWAWSGTRGVAELGFRPARHLAEVVLGEVTETAKGHPYMAGVLAGAAGLGAAMAIGLGELAAAVAIGYGTYLMLAKGERPMQALGEAFAFERGAEAAVVAAPAKRVRRARVRGTRPRATAGRKAPPRRRGR